MPTYIHDGANWQEVDGGVPTATTTGDNIYVRTSGTGSVDTRILNAYIHNGSGWQTAYTAYVVPPPTAPAAPTLSRASGWNSRVDTTKVSWNAVSGASGYYLETLDANYNVLDGQYLSSATTNSGNISITPDGVTYYFRVYAYASNSAGTAFSGSSNVIRVVSGLLNQRFTLYGASNTWYFSQTASRSGCNIGSTYTITKTGNGTDQYVPGYFFVDFISYALDDYGGNSLASGSRAIYFNAPGLSQSYTVATGYGNLTDTIYYNSPSGYYAAGTGTYGLTASGTGWGTSTTCVIPTPSAVAYNLTVSGYETKANTT